jgi:hypothetical protein
MTRSWDNLILLSGLKTVLDVILPALDPEDCRRYLLIQVIVAVVCLCPTLSESHLRRRLVLTDNHHRLADSFPASVL